MSNETTADARNDILGELQDLQLRAMALGLDFTRQALHYAMQGVWEDRDPHPNTSVCLDGSQQQGLIRSVVRAVAENDAPALADDDPRLLRVTEARLAEIIASNINHYVEGQHASVIQKAADA